MRRVHVLAAAPFCLITAALLCAAGRKPSSGPSFYVTFTVYDNDANGVTTHIGSDDYNGSGFATYSYLKDPNTSTDVYAGDTLFLDLYSQSTRTLFIDADHPLPGSPSGPAPGKYWQNVELYSGCYDASGNKLQFQAITGSSGNCRIGVDFYSSGVKYKLDMGPVYPSGITSAPATGWAYIVCNSVSAAGQCTSWTITPNQNGNGVNPALANVANLYYWTKSGKITYIGQYYDTYRIGFTNP